MPTPRPTFKDLVLASEFTGDAVLVEELAAVKAVVAMLGIKEFEDVIVVVAAVVVSTTASGVRKVTKLPDVSVLYTSIEPLDEIGNDATSTKWASNVIAVK